MYTENSLVTCAFSSLVQALCLLSTDNPPVLNLLPAGTPSGSSVYVLKWRAEYRVLSEVVAVQDPISAGPSSNHTAAACAGRSSFLRKITDNGCRLHLRKELLHLRTLLLISQALSEPVLSHEHGKRSTCLGHRHARKIWVTYCACQPDSPDSPISVPPCACIASAV